MTSATQQRKKSFSSFNYKAAFKQLDITELRRWRIQASPIPISDFFKQQLERLQRFDLESFEVSKELLIDAICEEGLEGFDRLKVWKGAYLEGDRCTRLYFMELQTVTTARHFEGFYSAV